MSTTIAPHPSVAEQPTVSRERNPWRVVSGLGLLVAPPLLILGGLTSPPQKSNSSRDYVASLAERPTLAAISAQLYHYSWIALLFGAIGTVGLATNRGRALTVIGAMATIFGAAQISGLLFSDYFNSAAGRTLGAERAGALFERAIDDPGVTIWYLTAAVFALAGPVVMVTGLARARCVRWWMPALMVIGFGAPFFVPGVAGTVVGALGAVPTVWVGILLLRKRA